MITYSEAKKQAEKIVNQMTLSEKIEQINFRAPSIERLNIPEYNYWNEALHGIARAGVATVFPQAIGLAAMFDEEKMQEIGDVISTEGRAKYNEYSKEGDRDIYKGLTYWSPNINIFRDPRWGRGQETYGEDPYLTSRLGVSFIKGLQGDGDYLKLAACAKHFAVHSGPEADRHSFNAVVGKKDLYETYLPAFQSAVQEAHVESVMGAYNAVNGIPACVQPVLIEKILREDWGFKGHVVSDYGALEDINENHHYTSSPEETMALAMQVGCNLCAGNISKYLTEAVDKKLVTEKSITDSVIKLYTTRVRLGMFSEDNVYDEISYEEIASKEHEDLSLQAARKSIVLLKNDNFLPLDKQKINSIAVIGPNASSIEALQGNYFGTASRYSTFLTGIQDELSQDGIKIHYAMGCHLFNEHAESTLSKKNERESEALIATKHSDLTIICLGLDPTVEGEQGDSGNVYGSGDKENLRLPEVQERLLKKVLDTGKPVIAVIAAGSAISLNEMEDYSNLKAILHVWYPGSHGGEALADILFGRISPSGKLPITFYKDVNELPPFTDYSMENRTYRYFTGEVLYPFGYGLTYSKSKLNDLNITYKNDELIYVEVEVENLGDSLIEEVVQIYAKTNAEEEVPNCKLIAFKRVELTAKEKKTISFTIEKNRLDIVDSLGNRVSKGTQAEIYASFASPCDKAKELLEMEPLKTTINI